MNGVAAWVEASIVGAPWQRSSSLRPAELVQVIADQTASSSQSAIDRFMPSPDAARVRLTGAVKPDGKLYLRIPPRENGLTVWPVPVFVGRVFSVDQVSSQIVGRVRPRWHLAPVGLAVLAVYYIVAGPFGLLIDAAFLLTYLLGLLFLFPRGTSLLMERLEKVVEVTGDRGTESRAPTD